MSFDQPPRHWKHSTLLCCLCLLAGCASAPEPQRHVELEGQPNCRDLGGYPTTDGRSVKWGQVYRSGELPGLSDEDVAALESLALVTVVNFLTPGEIAFHGEDRLPDGVGQVALPIDARGLVGAIVEARKTGDWSQVPPELNADIHSMLTDAARAEYAELFRRLGDPAQRPLMFHCSHGVHRTGTAAAILLWSLGVPWETVRADYLLSNDYRREEVERRLLQLRALAAEQQGVAAWDVDTTNMEAFYRLQASYIDATREQILAEFGSVDTYLRDGLGLSEAEVQALRDQLLE